MTFQSPTSIASGAPGRHAHIFRPPQSPAPSVWTPSFATAPDYFSSACSRKRSRPDSSHEGDCTETPGRVQCPTPGDGSYTSGGASAYGQNSMMVNERYALAGGFDTPSLQATADMERLHLYNTRDGRSRRVEAGTTGSGYSARPQLSGPLARERNGVARMQSSPNGEPSTSWTGLAFSLVGKVFTFGTSVVKGFYAGGGKGYDLRHSPLRSMLVSQEPCSTPLPGAWQEDEFLGDFEQDNPQSPPATASRPPKKRRQTDRDSWVMVGAPDIETSPRRKVSGASVPRSNLAVRPTASRASSRRSLAPLPPRQSSHATYSTGSPAQHAPAPSALERRASFVPMRSNSRPSSSSGPVQAVNPSLAYVSPEAEKILRRREKQDRKADAAMSDMSRKLAGLIRQGQEALGTKISVEGGEETD